MKTIRRYSPPPPRRGGEGRRTLGRNKIVRWINKCKFWNQVSVLRSGNVILYYSFYTLRSSHAIKHNVSWIFTVYLTFLTVIHILINQYFIPRKYVKSEVVISCSRFRLMDRIFHKKDTTVNWFLVSMTLTPIT